MARSAARRRVSGCSGPARPPARRAFRERGVELDAPLGAARAATTGDRRRSRCRRPRPLHVRSSALGDGGFGGLNGASSPATPRRRRRRLASIDSPRSSAWKAVARLMSAG